MARGWNCTRLKWHAVEKARDWKYERSKLQRLKWHRTKCLDTRDNTKNINHISDHSFKCLQYLGSQLTSQIVLRSSASPLFKIKNRICSNSIQSHIPAIIRLFFWVCSNFRRQASVLMGYETNAASFNFSEKRLDPDELRRVSLWKSVCIYQQWVWQRRLWSFHLGFESR